MADDAWFDRLWGELTHARDVKMSGPIGWKWLRVCRVIVGKNGDPETDTNAKGIMVDGLRVRFEVSKNIYRTPNSATIWIYNLAPENEKKIANEFDDVVLIAGYKGERTANGKPGEGRVIFRGNIRFSYFYREGNDRVAEIVAGDGDKDFHGTLVNFTLTKDSTDADALNKVLKAFPTVKKGHIKGKNLKKSRVRGRVYSGDAKAVLDDVAKNNDANWSFQDQKLTMVPVDTVLPTEALLVSSDTGLLSAPEVNDKGITIKMLLDGRAIPNGKLWLENNEVRLKRLQQEQTGQKRKKKGPAQPVRKDPDGVYKIFAVKHTGDSRGSQWETEIRCVGLDQPIPSDKGLPASSSPDGDIL